MSKDTVGQLIRDARKKQGLTMEQLGKKMGISGSLVGRYERGEENPKIETVERFANALGVFVAELYPDWLWADDIKKLEKSKSTSYQARLLRAVNELDGCVSAWSYENGDVTPEEENAYAEKILPEVAKKHDVPPEELKKIRPVYESADDLFGFVDVSNLSVTERGIIRLFCMLNEEGKTNRDPQIPSRQPPKPSACLGR